jgi:hypothetical protein
VIKVRQFRSAQLYALYAISLATGHEGGDASHLYQDVKLIGHVYSAPYALLEPGLVLVAADGDEVVGFAAGAIDTLGGCSRTKLVAGTSPPISRSGTGVICRLDR